MQRRESARNDDGVLLVLIFIAGQTGFLGRLQPRRIPGGVGATPEEATTGAPDRLKRSGATSLGGVTHDLGKGGGAERWHGELSEGKIFVEDPQNLMKNIAKMENIV